MKFKLIFGKMIHFSFYVKSLENRVLFTDFMAKGSAEASVEIAEASGFGRTQFQVVRSFTS